MASYKDMVAWCLGEVGYLEKSAQAVKNDPKVLYDKTKGAGKDNYTYYGKEMHDIYPSVMDYPAPWCDCFIDYGFYHNYGVATAKSLLCGNFDDYTVASAMMYQKHGALDKEALIGSQMFFSHKNTVESIYHTEFVIAVHDTFVETVGGNTSGGSKVIANGGGVVRKRYLKSSSAFKNAFFGHPKYDDDPRKTAKPVAKAKVGKPSKTVKHAGTVTASALSVRKWAGIGNERLTSMPYIYRGDVLNICDEIKADDGSLWYYVALETCHGKDIYKTDKDEKIYGFVHSAYVR